MTQGVDASHYQSSAQITAAIASGAAFVINKATEGATGVDPAHTAHVTLTRLAGAVVGHYHFAKVCSQVVAEAAHFLAVAKPVPGEIVALDLEAMDGNWPQRVSYAVTWLHLVEAGTGGLPWRYMNKSWLGALTANASAGQQAALDRYPLWIATGGLVAGQPGVSGWAVHQYSTAGGIDHDVLAPGVQLADLTIPVPLPVEEDMFVYYVKQGDATGAGYVLNGASRYHVSADEAKGRTAAGDTVKMVHLPTTDPFWALPETGSVVGGVDAGAVADAVLAKIKAALP